jgi:hypothetical protein
MIEKVLKKYKTGTTVARGTITLKQKKIIEGLVGILGSNEQDVVSKILIMWMYNEGYLKEGQMVKRGEMKNG